MTARRLKPLLPAIGTLLLVFAFSAHAAHAGTSYTAAPSGGDWDSPDTWVGMVPPTSIGLDDFVSIPAGVTVTISSADTVTDNGGYIFVTGTLAVDGTLDGLGGIISNTGTFSVSGSVTLTGVSSIENYGGAVDVLGGGTLSLNSGTYLDNELDTATLAYPTVLIASGGTLDNGGQITVNSGAANLAAITNEGTFNNNDGGTVSISAHLYNDGTFNSAPGATVLVYDDLENNGQFLNGGTLYLGGGGVLNPGTFTNAGTLNIGYMLTFDSTGPFINANGGTITVQGTLGVGPSPATNQAGATITVDEGTLQINDGTMTNDGAIVVGTSPGGTFQYGELYNNGDGTLTIDQQGTFTGVFISNRGSITNQGSFANNFVENYASMTNGYYGLITISGPTYLINEIGGTLTNNNGGTITTSTAGQPQNLGTLNNYGLLSSVYPGSINSDSSSFYNYCPTGSVTVAIVTDGLLPINEGCTLTFQQGTLPPGQGWGVTVYTLEQGTNGVTGALVWSPIGNAHYTGTASSIQVPNVSGQAFSYSVDSPIASGPDITFNCEDTVLQPSPGSHSYYTCSETGAAILTGPATIYVNYGGSYHIPTTTTIAPGSASVFASNPNGFTFTVTVADSNTALSSAPNGAVALSDGGAGGAFGDPYGDGPGSYGPSCLGEVDSYTSQCQFTYYPNPVGGSTTTVTITATFEGDGFHTGSSATATVTVTYYLACPQVPDKGGTNLKGANLQGCNLAGYDLSGDNLMGANIAQADLQGANLQGANMKGVNLANSNLQGANLKGANLMGATLDGDQAQNANFQGANLKGDSLQNGNFSGASFQGANMMNDNLSNSDFDGANFTGANTKGDITTGATFAGAINPP